MQVTDTESILDREQLRDVTLNDPELMKEILKTLVDDTSLQLGRLEQAVREANMSQCARLAHYCKGACANVGANAMATLLKRLELEAVAGKFGEAELCYASLPVELERLRHEARSL